MKKVLIIALIVWSCSGFLGAQDYRTYSVREINTFSSNESVPVLYDTGMVYLSNFAVAKKRKIETTSGERGAPKSTPKHIYFAPTEKNGKFGKSERFSEVIMTEGNDGPICFAQDGRMLAVCLQNGYAGQGLPENGYFTIYFAYKDGDTWGEYIPFEHSSIDINYYSPFLTEDGNELYFSANGLDDSEGDWDIYVSRKEGNHWTEPENLGPVINTPGTEMFPYFHPRQRLYFSSNRHNSRGGSFDLFSSNIYNGTWTRPIPVPTLNSYNDEISIIIDEDYSEGYFTRRSGNNTDIYRFEYPVFEKFTNPRPIQRNRFCFRLRENTLDTIDYEVFSYEWVINDTLRLPGHDIKFCFPGPGFYHLKFNVTNKLTDTVMEDVANLDLNLTLMEQPVITYTVNGLKKDTLFVGDIISFSADQTVWDRWEIEDYYWDFDNGVQMKGKNVVYQYPDPGNYTVVLGIKEDIKREAEKAAVYKDIVVLPRPPVTATGNE